MLNICCHFEQIYTDKHYDDVYSQCTVSMSLKVQVYKSITKISWFKTHCRQASGLKMGFYNSEEESFAWEWIVFKENSCIPYHSLICR